MKSRDEVCKLLAAYYVAKFAKDTGRKPSEYKGKLWVAFDTSKRAYCLRGESLPAHPDLATTYPNGWSLLDYDPPSKARQLAAKV